VAGCDLQLFLSYTVSGAHVFDVENWNTDDMGLMDDASTGLAQIFSALPAGRQVCRKIWIVSVIHHPA
jgi:hypothetical protein